MAAKPKKRLPQNIRDELGGLYILQTQLDLGIDVVIKVSVLMSLKWDHKALVNMYKRKHASQKHTSLPSPNFGEGMTWSSGILCTNYGPNRRVMFPRHFFCSNCDYWEANWSQMCSNASSESVRNKCQSAHTDPTFPTTLMSTWCPSKSLQYKLVTRSAIETTNDIIEDNLIMSDSEDTMSTERQ